ncbi:hypothetical protein KCV05_g21395, partial [Aureobasidium melanogenum]
MTVLRAVHRACSLRKPLAIAVRGYATSPAQPATSPFAPRHLMSIADLTSAELSTLVRNAASHKA